MVAFVGLPRVAEAGELTHRPQTVAVHVRVDAARVGEFARLGKIARDVDPGDVGRSVDGVERQIGDRPVDRARTGARPG